ncbi:MULTISPECIES: 23S rRNA (pseudouridine(1915)-N(3))-methyltransferase RlmH [Leuconostoc]|uniref:Ribosomal RNA large subunit methyltransferase H n=1 Tax=Leuconostoc suionicum TaxID=1511761 RepID=A0A2N9KG01_9LACO|nr:MULTISPECIES: 23S rRNA (pseudouridine(1915)-N(3))-methyltransferase RlmH [Leuconostoc]API72867.1 23S rRNA (pseudouridine(1915)-N(3))-methyltransferase RlmH [Leuconostoc suionicum]MBE4726885.1 23S rRNA (pseudouridine(1915)-N(3))-methyltransferase RlmH [Leuconostoc suionicum]MCT4402736.1 23S rRNA (pseudouridine(1915)-N(3))-methyltransferase RlmH [Leuconostoc suionicum]MDI6545619.1 23S rRNA (pseudouridine(1915)-N(3))-methyltransferase RlmH [Leuconostoc suionicum]MDI6551084.1 23S rRNA (pseudour
MNIKLITVGKLKEKYLKEGIAEYTKRLSRFCKFQVVELIDEKTPENASEAQNNQIMAKEGERIQAKIGSRDYVIVLAIEGKQFPSEEFSQKLEAVAVNGYSDITFIIGGSLGLSKEIKQRANLKMSFGLLTLPHQLMRLVLIEQIYRAFMIQQGSPYHK